MSDPKNPPKDPNDPSPFPTPPQPQPAVQIAPDDPRVPIPLSDAAIDEFYDGIAIPNPLAVKRMAYEIKKSRGEDPSRA